tara:strand:+ start:541 stop:1458 length:918 start_codon:yes stop_codon:yes gene_type:complete
MDVGGIHNKLVEMEAKLALDRVNKLRSQTLLRLSTGKRVNSVSDDPVDFSIASKLKAKIAGLTQALDNVAEGLTVFGLVEGAYENIMDNLIEIKSLATQASNAVLSSAARQNIGDQIEQLGSDINDLAKSTTYNSVSLLDGTNLTGNLSYTFQMGDGTSDINTVNLPAVSTGQLFNDGSAGTLQTNITISAVNNGSDPKVRGEFTIATAATAANFNSLITNIDSAITELNGYMNNLGIVQNTFSTKQSSLLQSINVHSKIRTNAIDANIAKEQSENIRLQILQKTAMAALAQANLQPGVILSLLK